MKFVDRTSLLALLFVLCSPLGARADAADDLSQEKQLSADYLALMAKEPNATVIESGVVIRPIFTSSSTVLPKLADTVMVSYHLSDRAGKLIEESITADELAVFPLGKLIKCWQIAIAKMPVGSLFKITCPSEVAYGDKGALPDIKPGAALTFRVSLYGIQ
jgi:FKBP-type peptidyl-prolyl cis-trans isomerase FkpA